AAAVADGPVQVTNVPRRRMAGWQALTVANTAAPAAVSPALNGATSPADTAAPAPSGPASEAAAPAAERPAPAHAAPSGPMLNPKRPRRGMVGWHPLSVAHDARVAAPAAATSAATEQAPAAGSQAAKIPAVVDLPAAAATAPVTEYL